MNSSFHTSTYAGPQQTASQLSVLLCIHQVLISKCWANKHRSHQQVGQLNIWLSCWGLQERFGSLGGRTKIHLMITVWCNCMLNKSETAVWDWCLLKVMFMKITVWGQRKKEPWARWANSAVRVKTVEVACHMTSCVYALWSHWRLKETLFAPQRLTMMPI